MAGFRPLASRTLVTPKHLFSAFLPLLNIPLTHLIGEDAVRVDNLAIVLTQWLNELEEKDRNLLFDMIRSLYQRLRKEDTSVERRKEPRPTRQ